MAVASDSFYRESSLTSDSSRYGTGQRNRNSNDFSRSSHREMAVDVPDNYVAPRKDARGGINKGRGGSRDSNTGGFTRGVTSPSSSSQQQQLSQSAAKLGKELDEQAQSARIRKYQDDLRKRRADEERQQQEAEFLRTSLRGSHKLQALAKKLPPQTGVENPNYINGGDEGKAQTSGDVTDGAVEVSLRKPQSGYLRLLHVY
jgi:hypothetical protein